MPSPRSHRWLAPRFSAADADALFRARYGKTRRARSAAKPKPPRPAAGVLLRHTEADGTVWWMLGLRSPGLGGTWSNLGGSLNPGEVPLVGALREVWEEARLDAGHLRGSRLVDQIECGTEAVPYTLFVLEVPDFIDDAELGWENDDLAWFPTEDVASLHLHEGFARAWEQLS